MYFTTRSRASGFPRVFVTHPGETPMNLRTLLNHLLRPWGYELEKLARKPDAFLQQKQILETDSVQTILDVGANVGQTASRYRRLFPNATIHCLEPFPDSYEAVCRRHAGDDLVRPHQLAVAESCAQRSFFVSRSSEANSLLPLGAEGDLHMGGPQADVVAEIRVETITLDDFCARHRIDHVNVLKMDIQGGELMALRGATGLLERQAIDVVYPEVLFAELYEAGATFDQVWRFLEQYGYTLYGLYNLTPGHNDFLGFGDAVFTAPRFHREHTARARAA
jgi:FkbM family methyltransferase